MRGSTSYSIDCVYRGNRPSPTNPSGHTYGKATPECPWAAPYCEPIFGIRSCLESHAPEPIHALTQICGTGACALRLSRYLTNRQSISSPTFYKPFWDQSEYLGADCRICSVRSTLRHSAGLAP